MVAQLDIFVMGEIDSRTRSSSAQQFEEDEEQRHGKIAKPTHGFVSAEILRLRLDFLSRWLDD